MTCSMNSRKNKTYKSILNSLEIDYSIISISRIEIDEAMII